MARKRGSFKFARREIQLRAILRQLMAKALAAHTGIEDAFMRWTVRGYHRTIYTTYGLELVGWPKDIPFADLSMPGMTGLRRVSTLLGLWQTHALRFLPASEPNRAVRAAKDPLAVALCAKNAGIPPNLGRGNIKRRRARDAATAERFPARYERNGPKSEKWVSAAAEARAEHGLSCGEDPDDPSELFTDNEMAARGRRR